MLHLVILICKPQKHYNMDDTLFFQKTILEIKEMMVRNQHDIDELKVLISERFKPDIEWVTRKQASLLLKCSMGKVDGLVRSGLIRKDSKGKLNYSEVVSQK